MSPAYTILASLTHPYEVGTNPYFFIWIIPLVLGISIVYKTIKLETITFPKLLKEVLLLSASIIFFIIITAAILNTLAWLLTE